MDNNPSTCQFVATSVGSAFAELTCECDTSTSGDGTFCEGRKHVTAIVMLKLCSADSDDFSCLPGFIDEDMNPTTACTKCAIGTYAPYNLPSAACPPCANGTVDHDDDPGTPCFVCLEPGFFVPEGSSGDCSAFKCAAGSFDHDNDAATPCQRKLCWQYSAALTLAFSYLFCLRMFDRFSLMRWAGS